MEIRVSIEVAYLGIDVAWWLSTSYAVGRACRRLRPESFVHLTWLLGERKFESSGRFYEVGLRIKRWKRYLPEAGDLFKGGFDKSKLLSTDIEDLEKFVVETKRAEVVHWFLLVLALVPVLFGPWFLRVAAIVYSVVANLPCLLAQRYNRPRLLRVIALKRSRFR